MSSDESSKTSRRRFLFMLGVGAGTIAGADTLFAKQFAREAAPFRLPAMVYDPNLQLMVDPATREPLYVRTEMIAAQSKDQDQKKEKEDEGKQDKKANPDKSAEDKKADQNKMEDQSKKKEPEPKPLPTVTAGCANCPKCDDNCG
jgi:hypothetical protein